MYRALDQRLEWVETPGTWVGAIRDIDRVTVDSSLHLELGDVMLLYTDGITEARNAQGELFGSERLAELLGRFGKSSAAAILAALLHEIERWIDAQDDDFSALVVKRCAS